MGKNHLKRFAAPRTWAIERKRTKFIARPMPGPHPFKQSIALGVVLSELLGYTKTSKELNLILTNGEVLIDKKSRKAKFPVGFMDVLELPKLKEYYRIVYTDIGKLKLMKVDKDDADVKILKVIGKNNLKGGKTQINLNDGRNMLTGKEKYNVGDSLLVELGNKKIKDHFKLEKGYTAYLTGGKHIGYVGKIKSIEAKHGLHKPKILLEVNGEEIETLKDYAFVVGKDKPAIKLQ